MPDENELVGTRQFSDLPKLEEATPPKETTAHYLAKRIFSIFQIALYGTLAGIFIILGIGAWKGQVEETTKLLKDGFVPVLTAVGAVFGTLFGSIFGFVLGHYYRKNDEP